MDPRGEWLRLLGLLEHMIQESERPVAQKLFRGLGVRRLRMAQRQLRRERQALLVAGARWNLAIEPDDVFQSSRALALCDDLAQDYLAVAEAYRRAASIAEQRGDPTLMRWMALRARMHIEHSRFLQG
ncbi:MAG: hypothetical protein Q7U99_24840 [Rubrivivax sp.]|nr:hypothetical protein [Rubrivivax sp.]MDP3224318.1 hypothetical protein [Rubrivivax sp.]